MILLGRNGLFEKPLNPDQVAALPTPEPTPESEPVVTGGTVSTESEDVVDLGG